MKKQEAMIIVIDGYNLLKQIFSTETAKAVSTKNDFLIKKRFIEQLGSYRFLKQDEKLSLLIVFDGGSHHRATREVVHGVTVIHSGYMKSADEWIIDYSLTHKNKDITIVTNDRGLIAQCKRDGAGAGQHRFFMDVYSFYSMIIARIEAGNSVDRLSEPGDIKKSRALNQDASYGLEGYTLSDKENRELEELMEKMSKNIQDTTLCSDQEKSKKKSESGIGKKERLREKKLSRLK